MTPAELLEIRRSICAHRVRMRRIPDALKIHDHMTTTRAAKLIQYEMRESKADDSEVEAYVAKHIASLPL